MSQLSRPQPPTIILDGGMGHQLKRMGVKIEGECGSLQRFLGVALANLHSPDLVVRAHQLHIAAGAEVITTNSYSCIPACLELAREEEAPNLDKIIRAAGECAIKARGQADVKIAGCIPPLSATYRPDLVLPTAELDQQYLKICSAIGPYSDLFLCESMSCIREACAAAKACANYIETATDTKERKIWIAFTLADEADGRLRSGESVEEAVTALLALDCAPIDAVLFNCCSTDSVEAALRAVHSIRDGRIQQRGWRWGGYANAFVGVRGEGEYDQRLTPARYADCVDAWEGASIVGGCCGVFPEHLAALSARARARTPTPPPSSSPPLLDQRAAAACRPHSAALERGAHAGHAAMRAGDAAEELAGGCGCCCRRAAARSEDAAESSAPSAPAAASQALAQHRLLASG